MPSVEVSSSSAAMWRWRMPERSTIHSFDVSTSLARSAFVITFFGKWAPTPRMTERMTATCSSLVLFGAHVLGARRGLAQPVVEGIEVLGEPRQEPALSHFVAEIDGARKAERIYPAV